MADYSLSQLGPSSMAYEVENAFARVNAISQANSARSADQARIQREWQEQQNAKAMQFNATEAAKSRNWQEYMSNTAHQREIADLKAAGLNPVLSAMGGNGAAVTSGATAQGVTSAGAKGEVDTSANQAIVNLLGSMVNYMSNIEVANTNARTAERNADLMAQVNEFVALIGADASKYSSDQHYAASKYGSDMQWDIAYNFPNTPWAAGGTVANAVGNLWNDFVSSDFAKKGMQTVQDFGAWLKKVFVDDSTFKKIYNAMDKEMRDKFAAGYYSRRR